MAYYSFLDGIVNTIVPCQSGNRPYWKIYLKLDGKFLESKETILVYHEELIKELVPGMNIMLGCKVIPGHNRMVVAEFISRNTEHFEQFVDSKKFKIVQKFIDKFGEELWDKLGENS